MGICGGEGGVWVASGGIESKVEGKQGYIRVDGYTCAYICAYMRRA